VSRRKLRSDQQSHAAAAGSAVDHCAYQGKIYITPNIQYGCNDIQGKYYWRQILQQIKNNITEKQQNHLVTTLSRSAKSSNKQSNHYSK